MSGLGRISGVPLPSRPETLSGLGQSPRIGTIRAMPAHLLIADDEDGIRTGLAVICRAAGHRTLEAASGRETLERARSETPDLVLLDLDMPEGSGLEILPELVALDHSPSVVILTGHADVRTAVRAMQLGAVNLLEKPVEPEVLQEVLARVLAQRSIRSERDRLRDELATLLAGPVVGRSGAIRRVMEHVDRIAGTPRTTALITGESGVGKELVARAIHERSVRNTGPFVALNCAAISESLLEAELFGYEPGAFTGGDPRGRDGLLAAAEGGSLLLDEIGEMRADLQAKLLRVLQERSYRRVGGNRDIPMDVRIIASTHRDLVSMVENGHFREDLYYRLNVLSIVVPPLRERPEDVAPLAVHFLDQISAELGRSFVGFSDGAIDVLEGHPWPGNVRELRNVIERAVILAQEGTIQPQHLALEAPALRNGSQDAPRVQSWNLKTVEEGVIRHALEEFEGNRSRVARELGINRTTLYNKLRAYEIEV